MENEQREKFKITPRVDDMKEDEDSNNNKRKYKRSKSEGK